MHRAAAEDTRCRLHVATACDNGSHGIGKDTFTLDLSGPAGYTYHQAATLANGD